MIQACVEKMNYFWCAGEYQEKPRGGRIKISENISEKKLNPDKTPKSGTENLPKKQQLTQNSVGEANLTWH